MERHATVLAGAPSYGPVTSPSLTAGDTHEILHANPLGRRRDALSERNGVAPQNAYRSGRIPGVPSAEGRLLLFQAGCREVARMQVPLTSKELLQFRTSSPMWNNLMAGLGSFRHQ